MPQENYSLSDKLCGKPFRSKREVLGCQIEFRVLSTGERTTIWRTHGTNDLMSSAEAIAIPTLARAIVYIDVLGFDAFKEIQGLKQEFPTKPTVELVEKFLSNPDISFLPVNALYTAYAEVVEEQQKELEALKKTSTALSPEPSGSSVEPSEPSRPISTLNLTRSTGNGPSIT